jgi:RNA polymerase sigma factor (sigma-70 family)
MSLAMKDTPEFLPTRRSLLGRLKQWDDQASWQDFFNTYWKLIYGVAIKAGLTDAEAQDVVQETVLSVAKQMPNFKYDPGLGSFKSWLFLITRRRIADHLRKEYRRIHPEQPLPAETDQTDWIDRIPDPAEPDLQAFWDEEWTQHLFHTALQRVKRRVDPKHFQIFDCYVLKQWPLKDVVKTFRSNAGQVYVIKHRISSLLKSELRHVEEQAGA